MISLLVNGQAYDNFISISVSNSLQSISGKFSFTASEDNTSTFPFAAGDKVEVLLQEILFKDSVPTLLPIANGFIDRISINYSKNSHTLRVTGRDKTEDIIDSQISNIEIKGKPFDLTKVVQSVLDFLGIKDIKILNNVEGKPDLFPPNAPASAVTAETGFAFINKYAEKQQILVTNDGAGNIVLTKLENPLRNGEILNLANNEMSNNVISAHVVYDHSQRFHEYSVISQGSTAEGAIDVFGDPTGAIPPEKVPAFVNQKGKCSNIDKEIRSTRKFVLMPTDALGPAIAAKRACWERALRIARTKKYHVTLQGFLSNDGLIWQTGQLVKVRDQFASIDADMLVSEIRYNFDINRGSTTVLTLVNQNVYKDLLEINALKANVNKVGTADSKIDVFGDTS